MSSVAKFFALTFAITWVGSAIALNADSGTTGSLLSVFRTVLLLAGTFAPALVAMALTAHEKGGAGLRALLRRLFTANVAARWYLFALGYMAAIYFVASVAARLRTGGWPSLSEEAWYGKGIALAIAIPLNVGEEIGWRGYALPHLADRWGFARASLILGAIWACWHLPLFYYPAAETYGQSFPAFALMVTAISVAMTWLYVNTHGSLLLATLMHWAINQTARAVSLRPPNPGNPLVLSGSTEEWIGLALLWIAAAYFLVKLRRLDTVSLPS